MLTLYLILAENALIYGMYPDEYGQFILFAFAIVIAFVPVRTVSEGFAVAVVFVAQGSLPDAPVALLHSLFYRVVLFHRVAVRGARPTTSSDKRSGPAALSQRTSFKL